MTLLLALACTGGSRHDTEKTDPADDTGTPGDGKQRFVILHTNDWQSHMLGWGPNAEYTPDTTGDDTTVGGLARARTLIEQVRAESDDPVLLFDGGDWMAGDLFQLLATSDAAELQMFQLMGYDAITLGNHEFDWGPGVLGDMITRADELGVTVPIVASNTVPSSTDAADDSLEAHFASGRIQQTHVLELENGLTVGLLGLLGDEAARITPGVSPASFSAQDEAAIAAVTALEAQGPDVIVALTHAGVTDDPATSPDHQIAAAAPEIDVIVGGHSHLPLPDTERQGDTIILQAGAYTRYLGELHLAWDGATLEVESYTLHELTDDIPGDPEATAKIEEFRDALESGPLQELGYTFDEPILSIPGDVATIACGESGLGNLITDAYLTAMNATNPADPIDFAFESQGVVRDDLVAGATGIEAFSDVFRVLPLGYGTDDVPGYALVDFYVTAAELKDVCEVTASISPSYGCNYFIEHANLRCNLDMSRSMFNRARSIDRWDGGAWVEIDSSASNTELYHVAVDSYVASLMGILGDLTFDAIVITAKDAAGNPYTSTDDMLFDADTSAEGIQELKLWQALVQFAELQADEDGDGVPDVPADYLAPGGRIVGYE
ncbi:MAG: bifunctional metallophosphatase/5'-nucleotidase [Myxococcota bacterium]